jgi:hydrogenase 3 maturation protease
VSRRVIVGVGNRLRGDDAIGCIVIDELAGTEGVDLIDAGTAPENYIEPVTGLGPSHILFVDACDFGGSPGECRLFDRNQVAELAYGLMSTHTLPIHLTVEMLAQETRADIRLLGIQPEGIELGSDLSESARAGLAGAVAACRQWAVSA